jgi:hypothetical protein
MKTKIVTLLLLVLIICIIPACSVGYIAQNNGSVDNSSYVDNTNYPEYNIDDLNQYGEWVDVNPYGRVWRPSVVNDWEPFVNGHWTYDGNDWVWVSYEPFGWIVYHYGYWENTPDYGWFWIPGGDTWSPARVQWINYGDEVGWAPLRENNRVWPEPWESNNVHPWMVVRTENFNRENITTYRVPNVTRVSNTNQVQIERRQPDLKYVQRYVKDPVRVVRIDKEPLRNETPPVRTNTPPVRNENPNVKITLPPVRDENPPVRTNTPPVRNENPNVKITLPPVRDEKPPVRTNTPPVRNETPPVTNRNTPNNRQQINRPIIHMQVPPEEKQKVDRYSPKVAKDVLIKRNPPPNVKTPPKTEERKNNEKQPER